MLLPSVLGISQTSLFKIWKRHVRFWPLSFGLFSIRKYLYRIHLLHILTPVFILYYRKRITPISLLELKLTFLILCETKSFDQIIFEHFYLACDHNNCVTRHRFESMLLVFSKILSYIDEEMLRQSTINEIVHECFAQSPGLVGLNEYQFNCLWKLSSKFSYYSNILALNKRIKDSEFVLHNVQCVGCRCTVQGLRFKCQKCRNFSLCIGCFSQGFNTKKHNIGHKMYEISSNVSMN